MAIEIYNGSRRLEVVPPAVPEEESSESVDEPTPAVGEESTAEVSVMNAAQP